MTIAEVTAAVTSLKPQGYTAAQIIAWLSELDTKVYWQLVRKVNPYDEHDPEHEYTLNELISFDNRPYKALAAGLLENPEDAPASWAEETWTPYASNIVDTTTLLAPVPYDAELYIAFLSMKISRYNRDWNSYNIEAQEFNRAWQELANHLNRTFPPCAPATHFTL